MHAGKLRHRIELQSNASVNNDFGEAIKSWVPYANVWAAVEPLTGRELQNASQISAEITIRVRIRYNGLVKPHHRVIFNDRILEIVSVIPPAERKITQHLMCKEVVVC